MPGLIHFLRCVGRAALKNGGRAVAGLVPFGASAYEIAEAAYEEYRRDDAQARLRADVDALARAPEAVAQPVPAKVEEVRLELVPSLQAALVGLRSYRLGEPLAVGDAADVRLAEADGAAFVLKASRSPEGDALLENERRALARLVAAAGTATYRRYLPELVESFVGPESRRVNAFAHEPGFYTLEQVRQRHPDLDARHLGWVFNRMLTVLGFCHRQGTLHGAVLPCHVLLHPECHGLRLVGWGQSAADGKIVHALSERYRAWYPPEVIQRKPATPATDLFLAARCLVHLAGGDPTQGRMPDALPEPMRRFLRGCLLPSPAMRPNDAWRLQEEFGRLLRRLYGEAKFIPLTM